MFFTQTPESEVIKIKKRGIYSLPVFKVSPNTPRTNKIIPRHALEHGLSLSILVCLKLAISEIKNKKLTLFFNHENSRQI